MQMMIKCEAFGLSSFGFLNIHVPANDGDNIECLTPGLVEFTFAL